MATVSTPNLSSPSKSSFPPSPPAKGFMKVFSHRRRSSEAKSEDANAARKSLDSFNLDRSTTSASTRSSPSREDESRSSQSGLHLHLPGHHKRQRHRAREAELEAVSQEPIKRGRTPEVASPPPPSAMNAASRSMSSLLTDGSENDTPPALTSRDSHTGFFTISSPLLAKKALKEGGTRYGSDTSLPLSPSVEAFPVIVEPAQGDPGSVSPTSSKLDQYSTPVLPAPVLYDKADTLQVENVPGRRGSISRLRAKSPARKIRDAFSRSAKSPRTSPERGVSAAASVSEPVLQDTLNLAERRLADNAEKAPPAPLQDTRAAPNPAIVTPRQQPSTIMTDSPLPRTPPSGRLSTPLTTVTPPTPTDSHRDEIVTSPKVAADELHLDDSGTDTTTASSGNGLSHRRTRSGPSQTHQKSKLSTSMSAPLTPTIEEPTKTPMEKAAGTRNITAGSGFFSSWVSAAQNAATSITSLTGQNRGRAGTSNSEPNKSKADEEPVQSRTESDEGDAAKRQLAVETLGSGNLDFSHLGLEIPSDVKTASLSTSSLASTRKKTDLQRDEAQAKVEDVMAKRAVSAAYEIPGESTPVAELSDPVANLKLSSTNESTIAGTLTPPNGSIHEVDNSAVKRSNSVRSKLGKRRSRGSSIATGQSTIITTNGGSSTALGSVTNGVRTSGFTPAPKQRNRSYHQQFRSVPEDDNLIEDYSCALQREILLAGRIYISEGHICFSSNILGWVTTLIISFEEIVSIERENTAMIIPNAIAIQTLHARHTFRSLLSREATFDLMIGIWRHNHPASFSKSVNGKQMVAEQAQHDAETALGTKTVQEEESEESSDELSGSDDDEQNEDSAPSVIGSGASTAGSELLDTKSVTRKPSGSNAFPSAANGSTATSAPVPPSDATVAVNAGTTTSGVAADFPGPATHAPTECGDSATHYDKIVKDEVIAAPLGKIYSLLYGPQSGSFLRKYLIDECKSLDLVLEDDKKGLTTESKSRQYSYIKPLGGSIGPKQTKCITTENLDFFDLDKSVSVTCTTQTPDVPSGNAFSTKTRYCLSWAPGNATRLQMNCTIEWTAKSWLKSPIEKGANDGQQQYGDGLVKALKAALGRSRGATVGSKGGKPKKKKKGEKKSRSEQTETATKKSENWGLLEPLRSILGPVWDIIKPLVGTELIVGILAVMVIILWFRGNRTGGRQLGASGGTLNGVERLTAYEALWHKEESDLWEWLEDRAGVNRVLLGGSTGSTKAGSDRRDPSRNRQRALKDKSMAARLQTEKWSRTEMQEAVRVTRERLDQMQRVLDEKGV